MEVPKQSSKMTFEEFFPTYLEAHSKKETRMVHATALLAALGIGAVGIAKLDPKLIALAVAAGYLPAFVSHWVFERNQPKTFGHPLLSFRGDFVMVYEMLTGKLEER